MIQEQKRPQDDTKKPHPSPDPTEPGKGKPDTKIPVSPDEDNDFTSPDEKIKEPENPSEAPIREPERRETQYKKNPDPDSAPLPDSPLNDPTRKGDPGQIDPSTTSNPALSSKIKMYSVTLLIGVFSFLQIASINSANAENTIGTPVVTTSSELQAKQLTERLEQIKGMDKSGLTRIEKKELRKEVKEIRSKLSETNSGVYISVGGIIIILLLLILLV